VATVKNSSSTRLKNAKVRENQTGSAKGGGRRFVTLTFKNRVNFLDLSFFVACATSCGRR